MSKVNTSGKRFVVIGSHCFTGSHIVDALLDDPGNEVIGVSRSPERNPIFLPYKRHKQPLFSFHQINLATQMDRLIQLLETTRPHVVINVAALSEVAFSHMRPVPYFEMNTLAIVRLGHYLKDCRYLERYVHISTAEVYGACLSPATESHPLNPSTPYAVSKAAADMYLMTLMRNHSFPVMLIRSTNVYGKHQQLYKIIPRSMVYLRMGKRIELDGGGKAVKTWVHVRDVTDGILKAIQRGSPGIYHFSDVNSFSVADLVRQLCRLLGKDFESNTVSVLDRLGQDAQYLLNYSKAKQELGWSPKVCFEEGVKETLSWLEECWSDVTNEPLVNVLST